MTRPRVDKVGPMWGIWIDDGDELFVCQTLSEALAMVDRLMAWAESN